MDLVSIETFLFHLTMQNYFQIKKKELEKPLSFFHSIRKKEISNLYIVQCVKYAKMMVFSDPYFTVYRLNVRKTIIVAYFSQCIFAR